jgi:hypothetical protein
MKTLWREPLLHFLVLGALLFLVFDLTREEGRPDQGRIVVTAGQVEQLAAQFSRTWMRPPTEDELANLVEQHVRSEVFYREALAMGLDRDDPYVRNRLALKLEFLLDDLSAETAPTDAELRRFLEQHPQRFSEPARLSFRQVYLDPERHGDTRAETERRLEALRAGGDPAGLGDPTLLGSAYDDFSRDGVAREFGEAFADALLKLELDRWSGPLRSPFGIHLVLVTARQPARLPALEEVREAVLAEWRDGRRREAREQAFERLRARYEIVIEPAAREVRTDGTADGAAPDSAPRGGL